MSQREFFLARAAEARSEAEAALLDNVRERCLRSEAAWNDMAARANRAERLRARLIAEKASSVMIAEPVIAAE
jgi:hypothetical protein